MVQLHSIFEASARLPKVKKQMKPTKNPVEAFINGVEEYRRILQAIRAAGST